MARTDLEGRFSARPRSWPCGQAPLQRKHEVVGSDFFGMLPAWRMELYQIASKGMGGRHLGGQGWLCRVWYAKLSAPPWFGRVC